MKPEEMLWNAPKPPKPTSRPGERLLEFVVEHDCYLCELRDHGADQGTRKSREVGCAPR